MRNKRIRLINFIRLKLRIPIRICDKCNHIYKIYDNIDYDIVEDWDGSFHTQIDGFACEECWWELENKHNSYGQSDK